MESLNGFYNKNRFIKDIAKKLCPKFLYKYIAFNFGNAKDIRIIIGNNKLIINSERNLVKGAFPVFYWDGELNFGDVIGPYLISSIVKKPVVNILDISTTGYMTVGSILQLVDRYGLIVWGSGFIEPPTSSCLLSLKKYNPEILSVRGFETAKYLDKIKNLNINLEACGDPALLMPHFYTPKQIVDKKKIAVCPHYMHIGHFTKYLSKSDDLKFIDVQKDIENVIDEISSSSVCISTSLHGLIIAQAYGVPWIWLEIIDNELRGGDFKFNDFFSTINKSQVSHVKLQIRDLQNINFKLLASEASLPDKKYNQQLMLKIIKERLDVDN